MKQKNFSRFINTAKPLTRKQDQAVQRILAHGDKKESHRHECVKNEIRIRNLLAEGSRIVGRHWGWHCRPKVSVAEFETFVRKNCKVLFKCKSVYIYKTTCLTPTQWQPVMNCDLFYKNFVYVAVRGNRETMYDYLRERL